jgi:glycosyltransferase involved in cell wall biosynthesis
MSFARNKQVFRLRREIKASDAVLIWFAGRHAAPAVLLARWYRTPVITVAGGYDVAWVPEIGYGTPPGSRRERLVRWILNHSDSILAVSEDMRAGVRRIAPHAIEKTTLLYNAVDVTRFNFDPRQDRQGVLSVGLINTGTLIKKGWRLFWALAAAMPEVPFTAVGPAIDAAGKQLVSDRPANLTYLGELTGADLTVQYQRAAVYFQGSRHESFSLSLAESMASGCIPVVARRGALPEVAGEFGHYFDQFTPECAAATVREALATPKEHRTLIRQRIVELFNTDRRRKGLCDVVANVLDTRSRSKRR